MSDLSSKEYYVYILRCGDDTLYCGITTDVCRRFSEHQKGSTIGAKYTRSKKVKKVEAVWRTESRQLASKLEYNIKKLSRKKKEELIESSSVFDVLFCEKLETNKYFYEKNLSGIIPAEAEG